MNVSGFQTRKRSAAKNSDSCNLARNLTHQGGEKGEAPLILGIFLIRRYLAGFKMRPYLRDPSLGSREISQCQSNQTTKLRRILDNNESGKANICSYDERFLTDQKAHSLFSMGPGSSNVCFVQLKL